MAILNPFHWIGPRNGCGTEIRTHVWISLGFLKMIELLTAKICEKSEEIAKIPKKIRKKLKKVAKSRKKSQKAEKSRKKQLLLCKFPFSLRK